MPNTSSQGEIYPNTPVRCTWFALPSHNLPACESRLAKRWAKSSAIKSNQSVASASTLGFRSGGQDSTLYSYGGTLDDSNLTDRVNDSAGIDSAVESHTRAFLELQLMHAYDTITRPSIYMENDDTAADVCISAVPRLAFSNDALLKSVFSFTALQLA
ncbi:uncharacterized protein A1O9_08618 [Exophiala aquamarina CBS 119918]|uniref:Uncharacterized protein n=1 Tax=Exophiala aquamarina CBS 119918 TaxID=1182545 RepID=A0A072P526_9EURO|nr:uncharacterized protein A1O9_08618 [Exophiala aquamarina CBS 119918]KEF54966.1 hypothetical protein A1O9_08618 [Exophiala aquamarina CBS 119918]